MTSFNQSLHYLSIAELRHPEILQSGCLKNHMTSFNNQIVLFQHNSTLLKSRSLFPAPFSVTKWLNYILIFGHLEQ